MTVKIYKISCGKKYNEFDFECMSNKHAEVVCKNKKESMGLIGRYYCETEEGHCFTI